MLTYEFVRRFFKEGVEFDSLYATMIARRLPALPDGVDGKDIWVRVTACGLASSWWGVACACVCILCVDG